MANQPQDITEKALTTTITVTATFCKTLRNIPVEKRYKFVNK